MPGMRVSSGGDGQAMLTSTRSATGSGGCVTIFVDGAKWQQLEAGDLDSFIKPDEIAAIEVYQSGSAMPVEFQTSGQDCAAVVAWTKMNVNRSFRNKK
jgi:hypothetical protein